MRGFLPALAAIALISAAAESNIDPAHALSDTDLIGQINWRATPDSGAIINQYFCAGFIYGADVGWINLGSGTPVNGVSYRNDSGTDFGVNVSPSGQLTGFAYGANIGWINFAPSGNPRVDWATGKLSGSAWSGNAGWISLATASENVRIGSLGALPDSDDDGLPDAWEIQVAGSLNVLSANSDSDHDGQSDFQEYLAGTNPLDPNDFLGPVLLSVDQQGSTLHFPTKLNHVYRVEQRAQFGSGEWTPSASAAIVGTGSKATVQLPSSSARLYFYRVAAYPPLSQLN